MLHVPVFLLWVPCFVDFFGKKCRESVLLMIVYIDQDRKFNVEDGANTCGLKILSAKTVSECAFMCNSKWNKLSSNLSVNPQLNFLFPG